MTVSAGPARERLDDVAFYLSKDDQTFGPHNGADLRSFLETGVLAPTDLLWTEGMEQWATIGDVVDWPTPVEPDSVTGAEAEEVVPEPPSRPETVWPTPPAGALWATPGDSGIFGRLGIGLGTAIALHLLLLLVVSLSAGLLFKLKTETPKPAMAEPAPLQVTMVEEPDEPPPPPPPPPDIPPPPPAVPDIPIPTDMPPPTPTLVDVTQPVISPLPPAMAPVAALAPPKPRPAHAIHKPAPAAPPMVPTSPVSAGPSDYLYAPPPEYPFAARQRHQTGTVLLRVSVNEAGQPVQVTIDKSTGYTMLDEAAEKQVANEFRFTVGNSRLLLVPISFRE